MSIVYLNGEFIPESMAKISVFDRGFLFCESVYEVIGVYNNKLMQLEEHIKRLQESLNSMNIKLSYTHEYYAEIFKKLLEYNIKCKEPLCIYIQITKGEQNCRTHLPPPGIKPTIFAACYTSPKKSKDAIAKGFTAITVQDTRRKNCYIKSTSLLINTLAQEYAVSQGKDEAIFINSNKIATEGTSSNLLIVKNKKVLSPLNDERIVHGVTRKTILKILQENNIEVIEQDITQKMLEEANEVWLTGSTKGIYPIIEINNIKIGNGKPGKLWEKINKIYQA